MAPTLAGAQPDDKLRAANPRGREAARHLAEAARKLEVLAPRGKYEPALPADPKFMHES